MGLLETLVMVKVVQRLLVFACFLLSLSLKAEPEHVSHYKVATEADDVVTRVLFDAVAENLMSQLNMLIIRALMGF